MLQEYLSADEYYRFQTSKDDHWLDLKLYNPRFEYLL